MSREERAKQFMPFGALKGYQEALRRKEREIGKAAEPAGERPEDAAPEGDEAASGELF